MKKMIIGQSCLISKCRSNHQPCSYCGKAIGKGQYAYSIRKKCDMSSYRSWVHFDCLESMCRRLKQLYKDNKKEIVKENIINKLEG